MTEDDFLAAIYEQPDDDLPRLAFADWLEERGDSDRAEFIRLQIELAHQPDPEKKSRVQALLETHRMNWLGPRVQAAPAECWIFARGLPEGLRLQNVKFNEEAAAVLAASTKGRFPWLLLPKIHK